MDVAGIEKAVLLPIDCRRARKDAVSSNEQVAELCALSPRFIGFASVDPLKKTATRELENAVKKLGLRGLKLDPALQDFRPHDRKAMAVYGAAADLGIPLVIHTGMSWAPETALARGNPILLEEPIRESNIVLLSLNYLQILLLHLYPKYDQFHQGGDLGFRYPSAGGLADQGDREKYQEILCPGTYSLRPGNLCQPGDAPDQHAG